MKQKRYTSGMNNRGSTLVEIIVSVLIVGIVFVPLIMGMSTALKANTRSEDILRAETVASNCVEIAKTYGKTKFNTASASEFSNVGVTPTPAISFADGKYTISNISEGRKKYEATVEFEDSGIEADNLHFNSIMGAYTVYCTEASDNVRLGALRTQSGMATDTVEIPVTTEMKDVIHYKQTVVTIDKYTTGVDANKYYIKTSVNYLAKNKNGSDYYFNNGGGDYYTYLDSSPDEQVCDTTVPDTILIFYSPLQSVSTMNSGNDKEFIIIENLTGEDLKIYVFVGGVNINIDGSKPSGSKLYLGVRSKTGVSASKTKIYAATNTASYTELSSTDSTNLGRIYFKTVTEEDGTLSYPSMVGSVTGGFTEISTLKDPSIAGSLGLIENSNGRKMYKVKVSVKEKGGDVLATKEATIIE